MKEAGTGQPGGVSEERIIELIGEYLPARDERLLIGPGDDAALLRWGSDARQLLTSDMLVEGVHFDLRYMSLTDVGWKALAVNISDINAMGGKPLFALGSLGVPPGRSEADVRSLLEGVRDCARSYGVELIGGDTVRAPHWIVGFTLLGELEAGREPWTRGGARPGELVLHTESVGLSQIGLHELWAGEESFPGLVEAHLRPRPDVFGSYSKLPFLKASSCIDLSDSLSKSLLLIARASGVGLRIDFRGYAFSRLVEEFASRLRVLSGESGPGFTVPARMEPAGRERRYASLAEFVLASAEDYGLLFTCAAPGPGFREGSGGMGLRLLGDVVDAAEGCRYIDELGVEHELVQTGFEHL